MKFKPKKPRDGINVSDEHPMVEAGTLIIGLSAVFLIVALAAIFFVDLVIFFVPEKTEAKLFSDWTPSDFVSLETDDGRVVEASALLDRLASHWDDSPYPFRLEVSDSDLPNAMAFPGGLVIVTTELLDSVKTENELAFVIGHELGHFKHRDHLRQLGRGIVVSILFAAVTGSDGGARLGINIADLTVRGFSREQETAADNFGLELLHAEYGHVEESWGFFERMLRDGYGKPDLVEYFSTHPFMGDRIEELKAYARSRGWPLEGPITALDW